MTKPPVDIGLVTWNRLPLTERVVAGLFAYTEYPFRLWVADNGSTDGTIPFLENLYRKGHVHRLVLFEQNVGIAPASNTLWELSGGDFFLKLDNDIEIRKKGWLSEMVRVISANPEHGYIGFSFQKQLHGVTYPVIRLPSGDEVQFPKPYNINGACVLLPRAVHEKLGYWCEDYAPYSDEDTDYSFRAGYAGVFPLYLKDTDWMVHLDLPPRVCENAREYRRFKDERRKKVQRNLGELHINDLLYKTRSRPLRMRRRFQTVFEEDGIHARLAPDRDYYNNELRVVREFQTELKRGGRLTRLFREQGLLQDDATDDQ